MSVYEEHHLGPTKATKGALKTQKAIKTEKWSKPLKSQCEYNLPPNGLQKWPDNRYQGQVLLGSPWNKMKHTQEENYTH